MPTTANAEPDQPAGPGAGAGEPLATGGHAALGRPHEVGRAGGGRGGGHDRPDRHDPEAELAQVAEEPVGAVTHGVGQRGVLDGVGGQARHGRSDGDDGGSHGHGGDAELQDRAPAPAVDDDGPHDGGGGHHPGGVVEPAVPLGDAPRLDAVQHRRHVDEQRRRLGGQPRQQARVRVGGLGGAGEDGEGVAQLEDGAGGVALEHGAVQLDDGVAEHLVERVGLLDVLEEGHEHRPERGEVAHARLDQAVGQLLGQRGADGGGLEHGGGAGGELLLVEQRPLGPAGEHPDGGSDGRQHHQQAGRDPAPAGLSRRRQGSGRCPGAAWRRTGTGGASRAAGRGRGRPPAPPARGGGPAPGSGRRGRR